MGLLAADFYATYAMPPFFATDSCVGSISNLAARRSLTTATSPFDGASSPFSIFRCEMAS